MLGYTIITTAAVCATFVSAAPTFGLGFGGCGSGLFFWAPRNHCLPTGGFPQWYSPPANRNCGQRWYWNKDIGCCAPPHAGYPDAGCYNGWGWDAGSYSCVPAGGHYKE